MSSKQKSIDIMNKKSLFNSDLYSKLGKKSEFEITLKAIKALFDFANGIKQAANITNQQLSQNAKDGLQYIQDISQLIQDIKTSKEQLDADIVAIEVTVYPEDPVDPILPQNNNGEVIS